MPGAVEFQAKRISDGLGDMSIDPISLLTLITALLPTLVRCFQPDDPEQIRAYVTRRYDAATGTYDRRLVKGTTRQAKNIAWQRTRKRLSWPEAERVALATLDSARTSPNEVLQALIDEIL